MDERLNAILAQLRERFAADASLDEVEAFLSSEGYDAPQIGEILSLLFADVPVRAGGNQQPIVLTAASIRVMGPHERGRFAPDAWGHLLTLGGAGMLTPLDMERVIERALVQIDGRIGLDDLRTLMETAGADDGAIALPDQVTVH